jgi:hypothetical protein
MIFCNVEGVQWLDDVRVVIASDKAKKDQPFRCVDHEQRVSIFALPEGSDSPEPSWKSDNKSNKESNKVQPQQAFKKAQKQQVEQVEEAFVEAEERLVVQSFFEEDGAEQELIAAV